MCVCKKIIILIIKRGNDGWVGNVYDSLLFVGLLLFVAHHIEKISGGKGMNCHVDVNSRLCGAVIIGMNGDRSEP